MRGATIVDGCPIASPGLQRINHLTHELLHVVDISSTATFCPPFNLVGRMIIYNKVGLVAPVGGLTPSSLGYLGNVTTRGVVIETR